ncbi:MAG: hypothetical protein MI865_08460 [Proteobacteria bacterium]|nr:hypothetical protein [Pseudomonadota bacterium]
MIEKRNKVILMNKLSFRLITQLVFILFLYLIVSFIDSENFNAQANIKTNKDVYLYVATEHTMDEFVMLLKRAFQMTYIKNIYLYEINIIMILDGPDINLFSKKYMGDNHELIDLARRLDSSGLIDFKVNSTTLMNGNYD